MRARFDPGSDLTKVRAFVEMKVRDEDHPAYKLLIRMLDFARFIDANFQQYKESAMKTFDGANASLSSHVQGFSADDLRNVLQNHVTFQMAGARPLVHCAPRHVQIRQIVLLLSYLRAVVDVQGPFLIVAPPDALVEWTQALHASDLLSPILVHEGTPKERKERLQAIDRASDFVLLSQYSLAFKDVKFVRKVPFKVVIFDQGLTELRPHKRYEQAVHPFVEEIRTACEKVHSLSLILLGDFASPRELDLSSLIWLNHFIHPQVPMGNAFFTELPHHKATQQARTLMEVHKCGVTGTEAEELTAEFISSLVRPCIESHLVCQMNP